MSPPTRRARREGRLPPQRVETVLAGWLAGWGHSTDGVDKGVCRLWPQSPSLSYGHWPDRLPLPQASLLLRPHEQTTQENQPAKQQKAPKRAPKQRESAGTSRDTSRTSHAGHYHDGPGTGPSQTTPDMGSRQQMTKQTLRTARTLPVPFHGTIWFFHRKKSQVFYGCLCLDLSLLGGVETSPKVPWQR
ncbi:hypothetical protein K456DRAFT_1327944 [Colletotrichum gloeosporioides 23]|nr:hypothetical protein K456DRAFT_1327944 [Colletotrichum gloeosporioides 23]